MKHLLLPVLFSLITISALAKEEPATAINMKCASNPGTTTFEVRTEGDQVIVRTTHVNGVDYMPIHEGVIVPHDFAYLTAKMNVLKLTGAQNEFKFPLSKCKIFGHGIMSCAQGERKTFGDTEIEAMNFYTAKTAEKVFDFAFTGWKATISLHAYGLPVMDVPMNYSPEDCKFNF